MKDVLYQFRKKDFRIDWFSGTGCGGQHRNKHQNCCRITHLETGLTAVGQTQRGRVANQRDAFGALAAKLLTHYKTQHAVVRARSDEVIRLYHAERGEVVDLASDFRQEYRQVVFEGKLDELLKARKGATGE